MMRMRLYSNDRETFEIRESDEETRIVLHSLREGVRFAGVLLALRRLFREREVPEPAAEVEKEMVDEKPVKLQYGVLKLRIA